MPELPEVETVCRVLRPRILGRRIRRVEVSEPRLRVPVAPDLAARLEGRTFVELSRRAKYLLARLDDEAVCAVHLGMSGKLIAVPPTRPRERHDHVVIVLEGPLELRFHDPRRFGLLAVLAPEDLDRWPPLARLGPDPLEPSFQGRHLWHRLHGSQRAIKDLLMDQSVLSGLGNIYANEALFRAGIRPTVAGTRLGRTRVERLARVIPALLREAIRWCGTTFSDYRDGDDREGGFQRRLAVYGRSGQPCRACGATVRRLPQGGRGTFFCPRCQTH